MGFFRDTRKLKVPEWASFFSIREYGDFLDHVDAYFRERGLTARVLEGTLEVKGETPLARGRLGLQNLAQLCHQLSRGRWPTAVSGHFDALAGGVAEERRIDTEASDFGRVREILKVRLFPEEFASRPDADLVFRPWAEGVVQALTFDLPQSVVTVSPDHRGPWKVADDELFEIGLANVRRAARPKRTSRTLSQGVVLEALHSDDFFTTTHALFLEEHLEGPVPHGVLLALPHRHALLMHPIRDLTAVHAVNMMIPIARGMFDEGPGSLSPNLYWWRKGGRVTYLPATIEDKRLDFFPPDEFVEMMNSLGG